jgi:hypothetical protein
MSYLLLVERKNNFKRITDTGMQKGKHKGIRVHEKQTFQRISQLGEIL